MAELKNRCKWCRFNKYACDDESEGTCDFKSLPFEKGAILTRAKQEMSKLQSLQNDIANADDAQKKALVADALDRAQGVKIMVDVLVDEFDMKRQDVETFIGIEKMTFVDKMKLAAKISTMQASRGSAPSERKMQQSKVTGLKKY